MNKGNIKDMIFIFVFIVALIEFLAIILGVGLINDLKATANGYKSDRNLCKGQLDSLTQELERIQNVDN